MTVSSTRQVLIIDMATLTNQDAFELGKLLSDNPAELQYEFTSIPQPIVNEPSWRNSPRKPFETNTPKSNRFKKNCYYPQVFIADMVAHRLNGKTLQQIADLLNDSGSRTKTGLLWRQMTVWDVVYSKQAKLFWKQAKAENELIA